MTKSVHNIKGVTRVYCATVLFRAVCITEIISGSRPICGQVVSEHVATVFIFVRVICRSCRHLFGCLHGHKIDNNFERHPQEKEKL